MEPQHFCLRFSDPSLLCLVPFCSLTFRSLRIASWLLHRTPCHGVGRPAYGSPCYTAARRMPRHGTLEARGKPSTWWPRGGLVEHVVFNWFCNDFVHKPFWKANVSRKRFSRKSTMVYHVWTDMFDLTFSNPQLRLYIFESTCSILNFWLYIVETTFLFLHFRLYMLDYTSSMLDVRFYFFNDVTIDSVVSFLPFRI